MIKKISMFLAIVVLSALIGLGARWVFAQYTNPASAPPLGNPSEPINIGIEPQTKQGDLHVKELYQKDDNWRLHESGYGYFELDVFGADAVLGTNVVAYNEIYTYGDAYVDGHLYAPNQGWEDTKGSVRNETPNTVYLTCDDGWYLYQVQIAKDGVSSRGWCASPFKKVEAPPPAGGGACFTAQTSVLMADGNYKNIADVQPGEYVLTRKSVSSSELVKAKVAVKHEHRVNKYLVINNFLEVTPEHKMLVNNQWKAAGNIRLGDKLLNKQNQEIIVNSIERITKQKEIPVYNLEIAKYQTYFAGEIYVHNKAFPMEP